jgi:outer membrane protein assembly factor BamB
MSTPIVYRDHLYLGNSNGIVRCFNAKTGERLFESRLGRGAGVIASLVAGDGKVYCPSENGTVYVLAADDEMKILSENQMGEPVLASPAISEGVIFFRTTKRLVAIGKTNSAQN